MCEIADMSRLQFQRHHCFSHGIPSPSPSICTFGQLFRKNFASSQEVICEQWVRPSQLYSGAAGGSGRSGRCTNAAPESSIATTGVLTPASREGAKDDAKKELAHP
jgi:hypothetical protein